MTPDLRFFRHLLDFRLTELKLTILRAASCGLRAIYNCCLVMRSLHKKTEITKFISFLCVSRGEGGGGLLPIYGIVRMCVPNSPLFQRCQVYDWPPFFQQQEAHGPRVAHLSDIATADMQMLCNIFPILSSQLMKRSSFKQFFILKKKIYGMPVN